MIKGKTHYSSTDNLGLFGKDLMRVLKKALLTINTPQQHMNAKEKSFKKLSETKKQTHIRTTFFTLKFSNGVTSGS